MTQILAFAKPEEDGDAKITTVMRHHHNNTSVLLKVWIS